ncbi:hypothetical protein [Paraburkholderia sp. MM6662-R1]|uniref:hypothetical protein n=1 Tax=Paraburkholderia sp. MM6662-R1 TaxID=2991066 RepID=UPI003D1BEB4C
MKTTLIVPRPLDAVELPAELDGRHGTNRANGRMQITAVDDLNVIRAWLARVVDTKTTFENYRKEAGRLLPWAIVQLGKPLSSLTHEDLLQLMEWTLSPIKWCYDTDHFGTLMPFRVGASIPLVEGVTTSTPGAGNDVYRLSGSGANRECDRLECCFPDLMIR